MSGGSGVGTGRGDDTAEDADLLTSLDAATVEARRTLDEQHDTLEDIDRKAMQLLRFTTGVLGLVVSALSVMGANVDPISNGYLGGGILFLAAGTILAGVTYTVSARVAGIGPDGLRQVTAEHPEHVFRETLVRSYATWIQYNAKANARSALLITTTILLVVAGALGLALGTLRTVLGYLPTTVPVVAAGTLLVAAAGTGIHRQFLRYVRVDRPPLGEGTNRPLSDPASRFSGQLSFKGDRDEE